MSGPASVIWQRNRSHSSDEDELDMTHSFDTDTYRWVKQNGTWRIEATSEDGKDKTLLPEGVIPTRAPSRFDETPNYEQWKARF